MLPALPCSLPASSHGVSSALHIAIVASHPVQYYAPWFRRLAAESWKLRVYYLWDFGVTRQHDAGFQTDLKWDLDLLSGYEHEFVPNTARHPGTARFNGLINPGLAGRLRAWQPDVVIAFGYGWRSLAQLALTWRDCPLILRGDSTLIGRETLPVLRRFAQRWMTARLLRRYHAFASVGVAHTRFLAAHGVPSDRIFHVPHCVDNDRWATAARVGAASAEALRVELGIAAGERVVLFAGKFERKKRPDLLIDAFRRAGLRRASLLFAGDGPLRTSLQAESSEMNSIRWLPFQNQTQMPRLFALADVLVLPSEGPGETWGLVVNEAMASGVPCLVSTHVGCREDLIIDNVTGWSFPAGDTSALALRLRDALDALAARPEEIRSAIARRVANYGYATAADGLRKLVDAIVSAAS